MGCVASIVQVLGSCIGLAKEKAKYNLAFCYLDDADSQIQLFVMELMQCATMANTQNDHIR